MRELDYNSGVYLLEMRLPEVTILTVGKTGTWELLPGYYYYVGTAQQNLRNRIGRKYSNRLTKLKRPSVIIHSGL